MRFQGTKSYIATEDLKLAVDAALSLKNLYLLKVNQAQEKQCLL